jgi:hypothetical protein
MSVTKLRRFLSVNKGRTGRRHLLVSGEPTQMEGSEATQSIRTTLASRMAKSKRNGSWFRLSSIERGIISLSLRLKVTFESSELAKALVSVLRKLAELGDAFYGQLVEGTRMAWAFADAAVAWGNLGARAWRQDRNYALFLGRFLVGMKRYR